MNSIYRHFLLAAFAIGGVASALGAVTLPARGVEVFKPRVLSEDLIRESDIAKLSADPRWGQGSSSTGNFWFVYSDRDNNPYYESPSAGSAKLGTLSMNEPLVIAKIENGYALVFEEPKTAPYPQISSAAKTRGWVPMDKLLLWQRCPVDENHIYRKAILAVNTTGRENQAQLANQSIGKVFNDPVSQNGGEEVSSNLEFFYIMKKDPSGRYLLSTSHSMEGFTSQVLFGWVEPQTFVQWSQRSCLEPTWNKRDADNLNNPQGKKYHFFVDPALTQEGGSYLYAQANDSDKNVATKYRMTPNKLRYPILDNETGNADIYRTTCIANLGSGAANVAAGEEKLRQSKERVLQDMSHVNLIFVIDGTKSMGAYFTAAANAIKTSLSRFRDDNTNKKVGVVIYRDYADGDAMIEVQPCVDPNSAELLAFLSNIGRKGYGAKSSPNDHSLEEALYMGLDAALDTLKMGYSPRHSNMMVVIGDAGNDPADTRSPSQDQIIAKMVRNRVQPMSFQVNRQTSDAFMLFNNQMSKIIGSTLRAQYQALKNEGAEVNVKINTSPTGIDLTSDQPENFYVGSLRKPANSPGIISTDEIVPQIDMAAGIFADAIEAMRAAVYTVQPVIANRRKVNGGAKSGMSVNEAFVRSVLDKKLLEQLENQNANFAFTGYVPKKSDTGIKLWEAVVFLSTPELDNLIERLEPASKVADASDRRQYIDALKGIVQAMLPDITNEQLDAMPLNEVSRRISGLNEASDALSNHTLAELQEPLAVSDAEYLALINRFKQQFEKLKAIRNWPYKYSFTINSNRYYWIPVKEMP